MPITAEPGTRFQYCTRCVVLAAFALERITGQSWEGHARTHVFAPLGMTVASFGRWAKLRSEHQLVLTYGKQLLTIHLSSRRSRGAWIRQQSVWSEPWMP